MSFVLTQDDLRDLSENQQTAVIDAAVAAAWADGGVDQGEMQRFERELIKVPWNKTQQALLATIHASVARVRNLRDRSSVLAFIHGIAAKLPSQSIREKVLYLMGSVMFADRQINDAEKNTLDVFSEAFAIPMDRLQAIANQVRSS